MNYEDNLDAPVWDELDEQHLTDKKTNVNPNFGIPSNLNKSFEKLSTSGESDDVHTDPTANFTSLNEENPFQTFSDKAKNDLFNSDGDKDKSNEFSTDVVDSSDKLWNGENNNYGVKNQHLIDILAPEENDLLADLDQHRKRSKESNPNIKGDSLFESTFLSPIKVDENEFIKKENTQNNIITGKEHKKLTVLFSSARLRRNPIANGDSLNKKHENKSKLVDPLNHFVKNNDTIHSDNNTEDSAVIKTKAGSLLEEMEKPLFNLEQRQSLKDELTAEVSIHSKTFDTIDEDKLFYQNSDLETNEQDVEALEDAIPFEIEVNDPIKVGELTAMHVEYSVASKSDLLEGRFAQVSRRYSDFRWLYRQLQNNHWGIIIPPPPEKQIVGRYKNDFMENRRVQMERMLNKIAEDPTLQKDQDFLLFLTSPNFVEDSKMREQFTGSKASNDSNDLSEVHISDIMLLGPGEAEIVSKTGGLDGEQNKSFISISFSSQQKYEESDEYFIENIELLKLLEEQLRQIFKTLEVLYSERNSLIFILEEYANSINTLANIEVTKSVSDLLTNFSQVHLRIKDSLEQVSIQEHLTLGITLDAYLRSIISVRAIFNQREKLGSLLVMAESGYSKAKTQLGKYDANNLRNMDKYKTAKTNFEATKRRYEVVRKHWQDTGKLIKREVKKFDKEKIKEFRNSIEIFLEASIESQKASIEQWETFYNNNM